MKRADHARGVEAATVVDDDRGLADRQHVVEHPGQRLVRSLLALDDFHQRHLVDGREEVDPDEVLLPLDTGRQTGDRQRRGVRPEQRVGLDDVFDLLEHLVLEVLALEHRLDHEVDAGQVRGVGRRRDPVEQRLGLLFCGAALRQRPGFQPLGVTLALLRGLDADVLEHHIETGLGRDIRDSGAHHSGAQHADLLDRRLADALGPRTAGGDVLQVEEERLDHVLRDLAGDQLREVAALDAAGGVEVHLRTLDGGVQDRPRRRHRRALELLAQQRGERRQDRRERGADGVPPGIL